MDIEIINGGEGSKIAAHVDQNNNLHTHAVTKTTIQDAVSSGNAYNINTGWIALTTSTESAVMYFLNDEAPVNGESTFVVDAIAVGIDSVGTTTAGDPCDITVVRNPTGGTIVSGASAVSMNANRNFGSNNTLSSTSLVYKGAEGNTLTGGSDIALFAVNPGNRGYFNVNFEMPKGSAIGIKIDTQTTAGSTSVYVAIIGHRKDGKNK